MTRPTLIRVHQYGRGAPSLPDAGPAWLSSPNRGCADTDPDLFFSDSVADQNKALSICEQTCPFLSACDEYATQRQEKFGVWGGKLRSSGSKVKPVTADPGQPAPASEPEEAEEPVTVDIDRLLRSNSKRFNLLTVDERAEVIKAGRDRGQSWSQLAQRFQRRITDLQVLVGHSPTFDDQVKACHTRKRSIQETAITLGVTAAAVAGSLKHQHLPVLYGPGRRPKEAAA
jgi:hypothetical protein